MRELQVGSIQNGKKKVGLGPPILFRYRCPNLSEPRLEEGRHFEAQSKSSALVDGQASPFVPLAKGTRRKKDRSRLNDLFFKVLNLGNRQQGL